MGTLATAGSKSTAGIARAPGSRTAQADEGEITALLREWQGRPLACDRLIDLIYPQLRRIASRQLASEPDHPSQHPSDVAQEALLRFLGQRRARFQNRDQFFAVAARVVRRLLVDRARYRLAIKRGGDWERVEEDRLTGLPSDIHPDVVALDEALLDLERIDRKAAQLVEMRYFVGLSLEETAVALGVGRSSVVRTWRWARVWLQGRLAAPPP